jgi:prophage tail gpP-like protein
MSLCKGFSTTRIDGNQIIEVLYALLNDGTVLVTKEHNRTNEFATAGRRWFVSELNADWLKSNAEFIGNYEVPSTRI